MEIGDIVPGGILPGDELRGDGDGRCSRCKVEPPETEVPLLMWTSCGDYLFRFCDRCLNRKPPELTVIEPEPEYDIFGFRIP